MNPKRIVSIIFAVLFGISFLVALISFAGVFIGFLVNSVVYTDRAGAISKYNAATSDFTSNTLPKFKLAKLEHVQTPDPIPFVSNEIVVDPVVGPPLNGEFISTYKPFIWWRGNLVLYPSTPIDPSKYYNYALRVNNVEQPTFNLFQFYFRNETGVSQSDCTKNGGRFVSNMLCQYLYALQSICVRFDSNVNMLRGGCYNEPYLGKMYPGQYARIPVDSASYTAVNTNVTIRDVSDPALFYYDMTGATMKFPEVGWQATTVGLFIISIIFVFLAVVLIIAFVAQIVQLWLTRKDYV